MTKNNRGFSLIEAMIVVAIVGILTAIAIPAIESLMRGSDPAESRPVSVDSINCYSQCVSQRISSISKDTANIPDIESSCHSEWNDRACCVGMDPDNTDSKVTDACDVLKAKGFVAP